MADGPKTKKTYAEFPLNSFRSFRLELSLDRITNLGCHTTKIGKPLCISWDTLPIVTDLDIEFTLFFPLTMTICFAPASMLFSTNSATAFRGLA